MLMSNRAQFCVVQMHLLRILSKGEVVGDVASLHVRSSLDTCVVIRGVVYRGTQECTQVG
jgi:hypothetical protein